MEQDHRTARLDRLGALLPMTIAEAWDYAAKRHQPHHDRQLNMGIGGIARYGTRESLHSPAFQSASADKSKIRPRPRMYNRFFTTRVTTLWESVQR